MNRPLARTIVLLLVGLAVGVSLAWVDTRPSWDDTGISAALVLVGAAVFSGLGLPPLAAALVIAGPLVLVGFVAANFAAGLAMIVALLGAFGGWLLGHVLRPARPSA